MRFPFMNRVPAAILAASVRKNASIKSERHSLRLFLFLVLFFFASPSGALKFFPLDRRPDVDSKRSHRAAPSAGPTSSCADFLRHSAADMPQEAAGGNEVEIREVWAYNLEEEIRLIGDVVDDFPYVGMDTEFPGVVLKAPSDVRLDRGISYNGLRANVEILHLIQLGLAFADASGNLPAPGGRPVVWQFNFRDFDVAEDVSHPDSLDLLIKSGIDFRRFRRFGIDTRRFAELIMSSGVVLSDCVHWVTFHSAFDFAYLLKILTGKNLPETVDDFQRLVKVFFPVVYDVKHMMQFVNGLYGGLNKLASTLGVARVGSSHQAGSDSLLTLRVFQRLLDMKYLDRNEVERRAGVLHGLLTERPSNPR